MDKMKQIIPFQKEIPFKTKVSEITSISLEHNIIETKEDNITGEFYITGDYKMTEGSITREKFNFTLPFDITLTEEYNQDNMTVDIDNFYYEIVNNEYLKVNIDLYVEGEKKEAPIEPPKEERKTEPEEQEIEFPNINIEQEEIEKEVEYKKPDIKYLEEKDDQLEFNIFENIDHSDTYVTYHVYIVKEEDTIDRIIEKYGVSKEEISLYNNLEDIKPGTKLIIPNPKDES